MAQITDEQLFIQFRTGRQDAFAQLVRRYEKELHNFLMRFLSQPSLAEDAFQETFLQVHLSAATFQTDRRFRPWLYTIAANKARDMLRSRSRRPTVQLTSPDEDSTGQLWDILLADKTTAEDVLEKKQQAEVVRKIVAQLPDHLRQILVMAYFNHLSYKEMAESLDIPLGTVKSRLHTAVANFAQQYREHTDDSQRNEGV